MDRLHLTEDLHVHTVYSIGDTSVVAEQTLELISRIQHVDIIGISDHFEGITSEFFESYANAVKSYDFILGTEVNGYDWVREAAALPFEYYIYHCRDNAPDYKGIDILLNTGKPVIIAHPYVFKTQLNKISQECYIEINNRYIWRYDWLNYLNDYTDKFKFVLSSDAHQPNWLNQNVARYVSESLGIRENLIFANKLVETNYY